MPSPRHPEPAWGSPGSPWGTSSRPLRPGRYRRRRVVALVTFGGLVALAVWGISALGGGPDRVTRVVRAMARRSQGSAIDPGFFAAGACEELAPTHGDTHVIVFLDAGHGGVDPGGTGTTEDGDQVVEATTTLPVELDAADQLRSAGYTVVVSRTADTTVARIPSSEIDDGSLDLTASHDDVAARDICANDAHAQLLVGIYFDAGAGPDEAGSITGYDPDRSFAASNLRFADLLQADVVAAMDGQGWDIPDDGVDADTGLGSVAPTDADSSLAADASSYDHLLELGPAEAGFFTTPSQMPGAVIEPLYLTDPFEGSLAASTAGQRTIAAGVAQAVEQYFAGATAPTTSTTSAAS